MGTKINLSEQDISNCSVVLIQAHSLSWKHAEGISALLNSHRAASCDNIAVGCYAMGPGCLRVGSGTSHAISNYGAWISFWLPKKLLYFVDILYVA